MKILAFETSHDDTSIAYYQDGQILALEQKSQAEFHRHFGGTVPEFAARLHSQNLAELLPRLINRFDLSKVDAIAYTEKPGLIGSLHIGRLTAQALSFVYQKPIFGINHLHGHILSVEFSGKITFPALALVVSGGHTQIWRVDNYLTFQLLAETRDDALGEAFDKVARALEIGFPGGPAIDKISRDYANENLIDFSLDLLEEGDFSFSGIKTKVLQYLRENRPISTEKKLLVAKSFQYHVCNYVIETFKRHLHSQEYGSIILSGGVAANSRLRHEFSQLHERVLIPKLELCTDNAAMIALACDRQKSHILSHQQLEPLPQ
ncbi:MULTISPECIES: tRNA (adenosine(37)-N6)-threonylcarbamoyltransferase complex transferase subunit TsaD [unclassified Mycoplasma]|uniref:tRNA (adenosine(37)-N6)-threonylcarbamoyltransferase complex transferase subunit TsaD n=1 Tax=unclassified Mycoplasma TaxID=2683645 RepID=UPI000FDCF2D0